MYNSHVFWISGYSALVDTDCYPLVMGSTVNDYHCQQWLSILGGESYLRGIFQLQLQLQLTDSYFSVIIVFQLQLCY